jgi:hypothetical protein
MLAVSWQRVQGSAHDRQCNRRKQRRRPRPNGHPKLQIIAGVLADMPAIPASGLEADIAFPPHCKRWKCLFAVGALNPRIRKVGCAGHCVISLIRLRPFYSNYGGLRARAQAASPVYAQSSPGGSPLSRRVTCRVPDFRGLSLMRSNSTGHAANAAMVSARRNQPNMARGLGNLFRQIDFEITHNDCAGLSKNEHPQ